MHRWIVLSALMLAVACRSPLLDGPEVLAVSDQSGTVFELRGLERRDLEALREAAWSVERWEKLWRIHDPDAPAPADASIADVPTLAGAYVVTDRGVVFAPTATLKRGTVYDWYLFPSEMPVPPGESESRLSWRRSEFIGASVAVP
jgi:hypothetical protein